MTSLDVSGADPRVLIIEDDPAIRACLALALEGDGYLVNAEPDGVAASVTAQREPPDIALIDVGLSRGPNGLTVARALHSQHPRLPVIFVTSADAEPDRLAGFQAGADDYVTKPFMTSELLARVRAVLRRSGRGDAGRLCFNDIVADEAAHSATRGGVDLELTATQFKLLCALLRRPHHVVSKLQLLGDVWGYTAGDVNIVEVHVAALRRKLEAHGPRMVHTVHGVGYVVRK